MKLRRMITFVLAAGMILTATGCAGIPKSDKPLGVFMTYGDEDQYYGFVDPEKEEVFSADITQGEIVDEDGKEIPFEDLKSGDILELHGNLIMTNSLPPIYSGIEKAVLVKEGGNRMEKKYRSLIDEQLDPAPDPSEIPMIAVEAVNDIGYVTTGISAVSFQWEYENKDGKMEHTESSEAKDMEYTIVELDKDEVETNIYVSSTPESLKLLDNSGEKPVEVELTKTKDGFKTVLKPDKEYEFHGEWKSGEVTYKFITKTYDK